MDISIAEVKLLLALVPPWALTVPKGLDPTFYGTLTQKGDQQVCDQVDSIKRRVEESE